ncbi:MAG: hypothetical protein LBE60_10935 [Microbacterium sp.]|jgi:hypothetical protein|uniref:hypothetical protein n=1 Tax=Microbacterium sp. TaxID=51671 RepID=UPI00282158A7|nr:hypothetical protein [Microbacterium sp.]MDR2322147.1 hypothetical protein [Microbacterium sp.]
MLLEITSTPRETLVWARTAQDAAALRRELIDAGYLVLDADSWELQERGFIPRGELLEFDPARIFNVEIGADANATLQALVDDGHKLYWHRWQKRLARKVWGVAVAIPPRNGRLPADIERAEHFGLKVRGSRALGLRMTRETYARINKRSSHDRWFREMDPEIWDLVDDIYEDDEHRIYTDAWCAEHQEHALQNYDLNLKYFASLDRGEFEQALQHAISGRRKLTEVTDLTEWNGVPGLYIMVLDEYCQAYVGATDHPGGIMTRIKQHWTGTKPFDRLVFPDVERSIISIDSFRALDTTRIFAAKTPRSFDGENPLLERFPRKFMLNRIMGGREVMRFAGLVGIDKVMRTRELITPEPSDQESR